MRAGIGTPEVWAGCGAIAVNFAKLAIVNRIGSDWTEGEISLKKAEETIGRPIFWQVPNDTKSMMGARNAGVPLIQFAPKSKLQQSIAGLARAICGKPGQNGHADDAKKERRGFFSFK